MQAQNMLRRIALGTLTILALCGLIAQATSAAHADAAADKKRSLLAGIKRVVVLPPFIGTELLAQESGKSAPGDSGKRIPQAKLTEYINQLHQVEDHARASLPQRVEARTPYQVVSAEDLAAALKKLNLTPAACFQNNGVMHGAHFPVTDPTNVHKLAAECNADAVILGVLDEPRRTNGHYFVDYTGINYEDGHVRAKAAYYVLSADGKEILHEYVEVLHPVTKIGSHDFLVPDWQESEDLAIEDFMDELTRYTPEKPVVGLLAHKSPRK